jgi:hypothetical protein
MVQVVDGPTDHQSGCGRLMSDPAGTTIEVEYDLTFRLPTVVDGIKQPALRYSDPTVSITALNGKTIPPGNYFLYDDEKKQSYHLTNYPGEGWILLEH